MKILVTGANGLVGKAIQNIVENVTDLPPSNWVFLSTKDGDLTKEEHVKDIFERHQPTIVVHLAANVGGLFKNMHQKANMYEDNILMNTFVLKYARIHKVKKVITLLSTCIFPDGYEPLTTEALHLGPPHPSNEGYAYAKRMMEVHSRILYTEHGITSICLTPTNIYGRYDNFNLQDAHVIPALIHRCYLAKKEDVPFVVKGSGKPLRQFIHSMDLARIIIKMAQEHEIYGNYICSPPSAISEISIETVAREIAKNFEYEHALQFDTQFSDGQFKKTIEPSEYFKNITFIPFATGIADTVAWFKQAYDKGEVRI